MLRSQITRVGRAVTISRLALAFSLIGSAVITRTSTLRSVHGVLDRNDGALDNDRLIVGQATIGADRS